MTNASARSPDVAELVAEFRTLAMEVQNLVAGRSETDLSARPADLGWSAAECIAHLSLTTRAFLPVVRHATELARARGDLAPGPYRMDFIGRLLKMSLEPPARVRVKTRAQFTPGNVGAPALVLDEFLRLQDEMIAVVEAADGVRLDVVKVTSPFDTRVRYNLFSAFQVIAAHQRRHLAQARRAAGGPTT